SVQLVQAAPDPVGLIGPDGVLEALISDGAARTDPLGPLLAAILLRLGLRMVGGEEQDRVLSAARRLPLPAVLPAADRHVCLSSLWIAGHGPPSNDPRFGFPTRTPQRGAVF